MGIYDITNRWLRASPWRLLGVVCVVGFFAGGLLDLDHIPEALGYLLSGRVVFPGRILHGFAFLGGGLISACAGGYLYWNILKDAVAKFKNKVQEKLAS